MASKVFSNRLAAVYHQHSTTVMRCTRGRLTIASPRFFSAEAVSRPSNLVQVYISRSTDPYLNLSVEHFLLQKSHPDSVVLLLYTNRPCIVIGRNQNPWVEVNLGLVNQRGVLRQLRAGKPGPTTENRTGGSGSSSSSSSDKRAVKKEDDDDVLLVRRRSGGGTVFHDAGNVNYSVICPPAAFDRDRHAEMVARALRGLLLNATTTTTTTTTAANTGVRVNERHDIVLDVATSDKSPTHNDNDGGGGDGRNRARDVETFKVSGSAYKLTRTRSLHHGTCLLSSPHLSFLGRLLRSPAAPYIKARGVESVRSPVRNVGVSGAAFEGAVVGEFLAMYGARAGTETETETVMGAAGSGTGVGAEVEVEILDAADVRGIPEVRAGVAELRSRDWIYAQTPQFAFSSHPTSDDPRPRPDPPADLPPWFFPVRSTSLDNPSATTTAGERGQEQERVPPGLQMTVRHGQVTDVVVAPDADRGDKLVGSLEGLHLHDVDDWRPRVGGENESVGRWLNELFGVGARI